MSDEINASGAVGGEIQDGEAADVADVVADLFGGAPPDKTEEGSKTAKDDSKDPDKAPAEAAPEEEVEAESEDDDTDPLADLSKEDKKALKEFVDKSYQGSVPKFLQGLREQWNSSSRLHKEFSSLKDTVNALVDNIKSVAEEEEKFDPKTVPEVQQHDEQIEALVSEVKDDQAQLQESYVKLHGLDKEIAKTEGEILRADDDDAKTLKMRLERLQDKHSDCLTNIKNLERQTDRHKRDLNRVAEARERLAKSAEEARVSKKVQDQQKKEQDARINAYFNDLIDQHAKKVNLDEDDIEDMRGKIRNELVEFLGKTSRPVDMPKFVEARAKAYREALDEKIARHLAKHKGKIPQAKVAGKSAPTPGTPVSKVPKGKEQDAAFWRERAARLMP